MPAVLLDCSWFVCFFCLTYFVQFIVKVLRGGWVLLGRWANKSWLAHLWSRSSDMTCATSSRSVVHSCKKNNTNSAQVHSSFLGGSCYIPASSASQEAQVFVKQQSRHQRYHCKTWLWFPSHQLGVLQWVGLNLPDAVTL